MTETQQSRAFLFSGLCHTSVYFYHGQECEKNPILPTPHPVVSSCLGVVNLAAFLHLQFIPDSKNMTGAGRCWFLEVSVPPVICSASSPVCPRWDLLALGEPALQDQGILSQETWLLEPQGVSALSGCQSPFVGCLWQPAVGD